MMSRHRALLFKRSCITMAHLIGYLHAWNSLATIPARPTATVIQAMPTVVIITICTSSVNTIFIKTYAAAVTQAVISPQTMMAVIMATPEASGLGV